MWSDRIIFYWGGFKKWMLSLLLNKNPRLSLGVVSHGVPCSLVCVAGEVSRRHDGSEAGRNERFGSRTPTRLRVYVKKASISQGLEFSSSYSIFSVRRAFIHSTFRLLSVGWGTLCEIKYLPKDKNVSSMTKAGENPLHYRYGITERYDKTSVRYLSRYFFFQCHHFFFPPPPHLSFFSPPFKTHSSAISQTLFLSPSGSPSLGLKRKGWWVHMGQWSV